MLSQLKPMTSSEFSRSTVKLKKTKTKGYAKKGRRLPFTPQRCDFNSLLISPTNKLRYKPILSPGIFRNSKSEICVPFKGVVNNELFQSLSHKKTKQSKYKTVDKMSNKITNKKSCAFLSTMENRNNHIIKPYFRTYKSEVPFHNIGELEV